MSRLTYFSINFGKLCYPGALAGNLSFFNVDQVGSGDLGLNA